MASAPLQSISGLASGLDTNTIISQLMSIERQPIVRSQQKQGVEEARQQALKDVKTRLANLSTAIAGLRDPSTWQPVQSVSASDTTRVDAKYLSGAAAGSYSLTIGSLARADQLQSNGTTTTASGGDTLTIGAGSASINVSVNAGDTLDTIASAINATTGTPVFASVVNSKLVLSGQQTGAANTIAVSSTGTLATDLGFTRTVTAADASYTVDSGSGPVAKTSASNTLTDAIPGVQLTLKAPTAAGSPISVTVGDFQPDTTAVQAKIQGFVDQYNSTLDFIKGKLTEKKVPKPQSQSDREKGVLNNDSGLQDLLANMRQSVSDVFSGRPGTLNQLAQAGLSTGSSTGSGTLNQDAVDGKLSLDATALASSLSSNLSGVKALFTNTGTDYASNGLAQRLDGYVSAQTSATSGLLTSRISSEDSVIKSLQDDQAQIQTRLDLREKMLRAQFTAMEKALSQAQSQGSWLTGQINSLGR